MPQQQQIPSRVIERHAFLAAPRPSEPPAGAAPGAAGDALILEVRALSARLVPGYWLDFPLEVLKAATPLLKGMPVMLNHSGRVQDVVGMVLESWWDDTLIQGAPGINARLRLDRESLPPNLLRAMTSDPPLKCAVSVTWFGAYEQSHPRLGEARGAPAGESEPKPNRIPRDHPMPLDGRSLGEVN